MHAFVRPNARRARRLSLSLGLSVVLLLLPGLPAHAAVPVLVNGASPNQWLESFSVPKDTNGETISVTAIVKHDLGTSLVGLAIDDDWNATDNTATLSAEGGVAVTTLPGGPSNYSAVRYTFTPPNMPGFSCGFFTGTRRVNATLRMRAVMSDGQRSAVVTSNVHSVENNQCTGPDDYPYLFNRSQSATEITPGSTVTFTFQGDDVDVSGSNDRLDKMRWRVRRLNDGAITQGPNNVGGLSDNTNINLNVAFSQRGRYVVEAELGGEDDAFGAFANGGRFFRIGAVDVNTSAVTSPTLSLSASPSPVQAGGSFTVTASAGDAADLNGRVQMIRWDKDNDGTFEEREIAADETTGLTSAQLTRTIATTAGNCADRTVRAEVTDNGAMNGADNIRRVKTASTTVVVNCPPVANNNAYTTAEDTALTVAAPGVLGNDTDGDGNAMTAQLVTGPSNGTLTLNSNGSFTYTPSLHYNGPDSFVYRANDGTANSNNATVSITVTAVNDPPVADNDAYSTAEDTTLNQPSSGGVLDGDTDVDGPSLSAVLNTGPSNGTLILNSNGSFTYTPAPNFSGTDSFTYRAYDGTSFSNVATVTITVTPVNDAPTAVNDAYSTNEDTALVVSAPGVLGNDTDPEGNALTAQLVSGPSNGTLTLNANGSFTYTPAANFSGTDSFVYRASDGTAFSNNATVTITVTAVNDPPVAANDAYSTNEDTVLNVSAPGVLANDTDPDGNALTAVLVSGPANGTLTLNANGSFTYTPNANYFGPDSFTYRASDGSASSNTATVNITVIPVNDPPVAVNDSYITDEDTTLNVAAPGVLGNDTDVENDPLTAVLVSGPSDGTLTLNADGSFSYTPDPNFFGTDSFTYKANDGQADSNGAPATIFITAVNDPPVAADDAYSTNEDTTLNVPAPGVLANDSDVENDPLTAVLVSGPSHGTLTLNADGSFTYSPAANYFGPDSFTYKANDGDLDSNVATVTLTVVSVNDPPVCTNGSASIPESSSFNGSVSCSDVENDPLTHSVVSGPSNGTVVMNANGSFTYTPTNSFTGMDSFTFKADDGPDESNVATFTITMTDVLPPSPTVTKTANPGSVPAPGGPGVGQVQYTVTVTHPASAVEPVTITALTDSAFGNLNGQGTCATGAVLDPGESYSCTFTGVVSGSVGSSHTNTVTATVRDDENNTASGSGSATVTVVQPTAKVSPAFATCQQFKGGSAQDLNEIKYTVQQGKISAVSSQLFYFSKITAPSASFSLDITQTRDNGALPLFGVQAAQTRFYDSLCVNSPKGTITITPNGSNVHIAVTGALVNEVFYIAIMYNPSTTVGTSVTTPYPTSTYRFETLRNGTLIASSRESILFKPV